MASTGKILLCGLVAVTVAASPLLAGNKVPATRLNTISLKRTMSKASDYVDKYAEAAMEQMRKYGIPASVPPGPIGMPEVSGTSLRRW